jgi:hypothetical protein
MLCVCVWSSFVCMARSSSPVSSETWETTHPLLNESRIAGELAYHYCIRTRSEYAYPGLWRLDIQVFHLKGKRAGVARSVQCLATEWMTGRSKFDPRQRQVDFSSNLCVQTGSEAHPASCQMGTGGPFSGGKERPWRDAANSPPSSAEVVNE